MNKKYRCIRSFEISILDLEGYFTNHTLKVLEGEIWEVKESTGISDIRLEKESGWIEITKKRFENSFEQVK